MHDANDLTIAEAARLIAARDISPVELTDNLLRRIAALDPQINAFITVTADLAIQQARRAEAEIVAGNYRGPLHGVPIGVKDIYNTAGILTSAGSKVGLTNIPSENAAAVDKLYAAGAVLLGKLATHEFAHGGPATDLPWPPVRNPWQREHFTGGSSSGPAAAVAANLVMGALGSDTGGSIRGPASLCGVVGLKPTYGLVSRYGVIPSSFTFDTCGPMARSVEDCAIMLNAVAGHDPKDPASAHGLPSDFRVPLSSDIRGVRVGVVRHFWEEDLAAHDEVRRAMDDALDVLSRLGAKLDVVRMRSLNDYYDVQKTIALPEHLAIRRKQLLHKPQDFGAGYLSTVLPACLLQAADYVDAQCERSRMIAEVEPLYEKHDVFVTAAGTAPAPRLDAHRTLNYWKHAGSTTRPFTITGGPALVLCNGFSQSGLPLGMQLAARPFGDATVLRVAHAYEQATPWHFKRPPFAPEVLPALSIEGAIPGAPDIDAATRKLVEVTLKRSAWPLTQAQLTQVLHAAPYVLAMAQRVAQRREGHEEPANVFRFPI